MAWPPSEPVISLYNFHSTMTVDPFLSFTWPLPLNQRQVFYMIITVADVTLKVSNFCSGTCTGCSVDNEGVHLVVLCDQCWSTEMAELSHMEYGWYIEYHLKICVWNGSVFRGACVTGCNRKVIVSDLVKLK